MRGKSNIYTCYNTQSLQGSSLNGMPSLFCKSFMKNSSIFFLFGDNGEQLGKETVGIVQTKRPFPTYFIPNRSKSNLRAKRNDNSQNDSIGFS